MVSVVDTRRTQVSARPDVLQIFLQDEDGQNILGIDDGALRQSLRIEIVNTSGRDLELQPIAERALNAKTYHFAVSFRPGTLVDIDSVTLSEIADGWSITSKGNTLYFGMAKKTLIPQAERMTLTLENISAAPEGGSRGTRVEIKYGQLLYQGSNETISGSRLQYLNIVNQRGKKQIPLYVGLLGSNTILNDGQENELTLTIQSLPSMSVPFISVSPEEIEETLDNPPNTKVAAPSNANRVLSLKEIQRGKITPTEEQIASSVIVKPDDTKRTEGILKLRGANEGTLDQASKFTISFDVASTESNAPQNWALLNNNDADEVRISVEANQEHWGFGGREAQGISPQWSYICQKGRQVSGREELLRIKIKNLKTILKSGYANLYVHFENIPGYWDGHITVPIHKGSLVYREDSTGKVGCVGIGTDKPQAKLHVKSSPGLDGLRVEGDTKIEGHLQVDSFAIDKLQGGLQVEGNTQISGNLSVTKGRVGLGTTNPTNAFLEVAGHVARVVNKKFGYLGPNGASKSTFKGNKNWGIYTRQSIGAYDILAQSDARIKKILGRSNAPEDLKTLMDIEITDYKLRDTIANGSSPQKKVIGQQLAQTFPQAVGKKLTETVPDIYQEAEVHDGWIVLDTNLEVGDRVKIVTENSEEVSDVLEAEPTRFRVNVTPQTSSLFVYGREVNDFHTVDYEAISMLNVSATQEQQRIIEMQGRRVAELEAKVEQMAAEHTREIASLTKHLR